jgi:hypothetical protein
MLKKLGIPILAVVAILMMAGAPQASARVHFGVGVVVGPPYYAYPLGPYAYSAPYPYAYPPYYYGYPGPYYYGYGPGVYGYWRGGHHYGYRDYGYRGRGFRGYRGGGRGYRR